MIDGEPSRAAAVIKRGHLARAVRLRAPDSIDKAPRGEGVVFYYSMENEICSENAPIASSPYRVAKCSQRHADREVSHHRNHLDPLFCCFSVNSCDKFKSKSRERRMYLLNIRGGIGIFS